MTVIWHNRLIRLLLVAVTLVAYGPVREADFVLMDDPVYVYENPFVRQGLSWDALVGIWEADLTHDSKHADYWQPVTFLSRMLDVELWGMNPGMHHLTNLLFHVLNTLLLFEVLRKMTRDPIRSGFVAILFGVHPLHVESVAWVTERKDVLSGFFWMLALWAYGWHAERPSLRRYGVVMGLFVLGLMSKPIVMVLPAVLVLLDWWPLKRYRKGALPGLAAEKGAMVLLSIGSIWPTWLVQGEHLGYGGGWGTFCKAGATFGIYFFKALVPTGLAPWHPPWQELSIGWVILATVVFIGVSVLTFLKRNPVPWFFVGWGWFLVTLAPVISLSDVAWAERFMYLPLVGIFIMVVWGVGRLIEGNHRTARLAAVLAGGVVLVLTWETWRQATYWKDDLALWERTLKVTQDNWMAEEFMALALAKNGRHAEAVTHYVRAAQLRPNWADAQLNLGQALIHRGEYRQAADRFREAIRLDPDSATAHLNLALTCFQLGETNAARQELLQASILEPTWVVIREHLATALMGQEQYGEAVKHLEVAVQLDPKRAENRNRLGLAYLHTGALEKASAQFAEALRLKPAWSEACYNWGTVLVRLGRLEEATRRFETAIQFRPDCAPAYNNLGVILAGRGQSALAVDCFAKALAHQPHYPEALCNLALVRQRQGRQAEAATHFTTALQQNADFMPALRGLAWLRATASDSKLRNGQEAVRLSQRLIEASGAQDAINLETLAAAYAESGQFAKAISTARQAIDLARQGGDLRLAKKCEEELAAYLRRKPWRFAESRHATQTR